MGEGLSTTNDDDGRDLLERVGRGEAAALERFYELSVDGLYAFVFFRVGKDAATAEDVVQETFLLALDRLDQFDATRGSLRSWLCQMSRNVVRSHLVERRRTQEIEMWDREVARQLRGMT
jgi:RNA polymerase sigma-70 factor (ECF subfamily)